MKLKKYRLQRIHYLNQRKYKLHNIMTTKNLKIYLNVYDFTSANKYLSCVGMGGYHTGVQINNKQYCYCVISQNQKESGVIIIDPETADYQFNRKIFIGQINIKSIQFLKILEDLAKQFTCGKYHIFKYNCNHFAQAMIRKILNVQIPKWIFRTTNVLNYMCFCLPKGFVSGQWALAALRQQNGNDQLEDSLSNYG